MKTLSAFLCGIIMLFTVASANSKTITHIHKTARQATCTVTLTSITVPHPYHMVLTSSTGHRYTVGLADPAHVPFGTYTASIVPTGGSNPSHNFHGTTCSQILTGSGTSVAWSNVDFNCSSASFSVN